ncbi:HNH endonuclease [Microbacterium sp. NPDC007973]|uniref:HNH endonuclease n=1 Tax=Microbacterium sp. NPDC007973 TaxID=3364182 RepID=UPI0036EDBF3D
MSALDTAPWPQTEPCSLADVLLPHRNTAGACDHCGKALTGRQKRWCSFECSRVEAPHHDWNVARKAAKRRDGHKCVKCGRPDDVDHNLRSILEVNHIEPRVGKGYGWGCWNHQDNLETLCRPCHVEVTKAQIAGRKAEHDARAKARDDEVNGARPLFEVDPDG